MKPTRNNPVQIVLNSQNYVGARPIKTGGGHMDFYAGDDDGFVAHQTKLLGELGKIQVALAQSRWGGTNYLRVKLKPTAWAKSHRPTGRLFQPRVCQSVGADAIGEPIFEVTPDGVVAVIKAVASAEATVKLKPNKETGKDEPKPSAARSETGAIQEVMLLQASDKQKFSTQAALDWFKQPGAAPFYVVDLFGLPMDANDAGSFPTGRRQLLDSFLAGLNELGVNVAIARSKLSGGHHHRYLFVKLLPDGEVADLPKDMFGEADEDWSKLPADLDASNHGELLRYLSRHPYVRRVHLPPIVRQHLQHGAQPIGKSQTLPKPQSGVRYPRVGVVDGGVAAVLKPWLLGQDGLLAPAHQAFAHGTFIAGLLVAGRGLGNPEEVARELDGCQIYDINIFPDHTIPQAFEQYHPNGFHDFLVALESAVETAKAKHQVRIFNLSINVLMEVEPDQYSVFAAMLDQIALQHDIIIVVSAGNLESSKMRGSWPKKSKDVLSFLVARTTADRILQPAESVCALTVAAVNPPGMAQQPVGAPTPYTRRGPGMEVGVKPDFAHYSGSSPELLIGHGLYSIDETGKGVSNMGTSFAAPLVAKTLAVLENRIAGHVPRETLIALMVHHAKVPEALEAKELKHVSRHFTGFGIPSGSDEMLLTPESAITMVFPGSIGAGQWLEFKFDWPQSLIEEGACRMAVDLTLVYRPFIDPRFASEFLRINLDASLLQHDGAGKWNGELKQLFTGKGAEDHVSEKELIAHGLKWWPTKHYRRYAKKAVGKTSAWKLRVESLVRDGEVFPLAGVPFTAVLTLRDPNGKKPVFREMRQWLAANSVTCGDITAGVRLRARS